MARNVCETLPDILAEVGARQTFGMTGDALITVACGGKGQIGEHQDELLMPPKIQPGHAWGFSLAKLKEIFVEEEID